MRRPADDGTPIDVNDLMRRSGFQRDQCGHDFRQTGGMKSTGGILLQQDAFGLRVDQIQGGRLNRWSVGSSTGDGALGHDCAWDEDQRYQQEDRSPTCQSAHDRIYRPNSFFIMSFALSTSDLSSEAGAASEGFSVSEGFGGTLSRRSVELIPFPALMPPIIPAMSSFV